MVFGIHFIMGQTVEIKGQILANYEVDGIHILNNTSNTFTVSNNKGEFPIPAKLYDILAFSGVSYELKKMVSFKSNLQNKIQE